MAMSLQSLYLYQRVEMLMNREVNGIRCPRLSLWWAQESDCRTSRHITSLEEMNRWRRAQRGRVDMREEIGITVLHMRRRPEVE